MARERKLVTVKGEEKNIKNIKISPNPQAQT
jgi:hypothetical protein